MKVVIAGGSIADGTGATTRPADVYVRDGVIDAVSAVSDNHAGWIVIDASGLTIAPGFIDVHSHADNAPFLAADDTSKILQGVTTEVVGNCGMSLAPRTPQTWELLMKYRERYMPRFTYTGDTFGDFLSEADGHGYVTNYAPLVGHGTIRIAAMGMDNRAPTANESASMGAMLDEALDAGAFGLSSGLIYPPAVYSDTAELVDLARRLRPNTIYTTHMRGESKTLLAATEEALEIGRKARVRVQISHHKAAGRENFGRTKDSLRLIAQARSEGVDVFQDVYPYIAGSTSLSAIIPPEFHEGGNAALLERLGDASSRARMAQTIDAGREGFENLAQMAGWDGVLVASTHSHSFEAETIAEIAVRLRVTPFEAVVHVLRAEELRATMVVFMMDEADVERVMADDHTIIGSDGSPPGLGGKPHPRIFGTFPRVLSEYVRNRGLLTLEAAVRKMTGLSAEIFGIPDRGTIAAGKVADIVAFDALRVGDDLDFRDPVRAPIGIAWVKQAGKTVVEGGRYVGERHGRRLRPML